MTINTPVKICVTCIDMLTLNLFYDYDLVDVEYLEVAKRYRKTNEYKINAILYLAKRKIEFKQYDALVENYNAYHNYSETEKKPEFLQKINWQKKVINNLYTFRFS